MSAESNSVYPYLSRFIAMMDDSNSFIRTRGLTLISCNARWDEENKIDEVIDEYLAHITDPKPITARKCIQSLAAIAEAKPYLKSDIVAALQTANVGIYAQSMRPLVQRDIRIALSELRADEDIER